MPRLIDADALKEHIADVPTWTQMREGEWRPKKYPAGMYDPEDVMSSIEIAPTIEAEPVRHGTWKLEAHNERVNYRWNVTAKCPECGHEKGEIYAGFFPGVPDSIAEAAIISNAESVKLDNYCPNCGVKMDGGGSDCD